MGEELFHLALAAGAQIDELEARRTFELCRIGHARTAESRTVGDARTDHHDPVAEGIGCGFDAGAGVDADFERFHLVEQRQVEQALLLGAVHVLDEGGLVVGSQTGTGDAGEDPLAVALDVEVHSLLREPRRSSSSGRRSCGCRCGRPRPRRSNRCNRAARSSTDRDSRPPRRGGRVASSHEACSRA